MVMVAIFDHDHWKISCYDGHGQYSVPHPLGCSTFEALKGHSYQKSDYSYQDWAIIPPKINFVRNCLDTFLHGP